MSIAERLANLSIPQVLVIVAVLLALRYVLLKQKSNTAKSVAEIAESLAIAMALVFLIIRPFIVQAFFIPSASMRPTLLERDHILVNKFIYRFKEPKLADVVVFKAPPEATQGEEKDFIKRVIGVPGDTVRITKGYVLIGETPYYHEQLRDMLARYARDGGDGKVKLINGKVLLDGTIITPAEVAAASSTPDAKVKVVSGKVYMNGKPLHESYVAEDPERDYPNDLTPEKWIVVDKKGNQMVKIPKGRLLVMGDNRNDSNDSRYWGLLERKRLLGKAMFIFWPLNRIRWVR